MKNEPHTFIGIVRDCVVMWRKREDWSRETVCEKIVATHDEINGAALTRIRFDSNTHDAFDRQKVNAQRIFRWLDDQAKDNNLLPANFIPSILAAMPGDIRLACINEFLSQFNLIATGTDDEITSDFDVVMHLRHVAKEGAEAVVALSDVVASPTLSVMENAVRELDEAIESKHRARRALRSAIDRFRGAGNKIVSVLRRGRA